MYGHLNGSATAIREKQPEALYSHCASHQLNQTVMSMTSVLQVRNMWDVMKDLCLFLRGSPKRQSALKVAIENSNIIEGTSKTKLSDLRPTRWDEHHDALITFKKLYPAVLVMLENMSFRMRGSQQQNAGTASKASSLLNAITTFPFIVAVQLTSKIVA